MQTSVHRFQVMFFCLGLALSLSIAGPMGASRPPRPLAGEMAKDTEINVAAAAADGREEKTNAQTISVDAVKKTKKQKLDEVKFKGGISSISEADGHLEKRDRSALIDAPAKKEQDDIRRMRRDTDEEAASLEEAAKAEQLMERQMKRNVDEKDPETEEEMKAEVVERGIQDIGSHGLRGKRLAKKVRREFDFSPIIQEESEEEEFEEARLKRSNDLKASAGKAVWKNRLKRDDDEEEEEEEEDEDTGEEEEDEEDDEEQEQQRQLLEELRRRRINDRKRRSRLNRLRKRQSFDLEDAAAARERRLEESPVRRYPADEDYPRRYYREDEDENEEEEEDDSSREEDIRQRRYHADDDSFYRIGRDRSFDRQPRHYGNGYRNRRRAYRDSGNEDRARGWRYAAGDESNDRYQETGYNDYLARAMRYADEGDYDKADKMLRFADEESREIVERGMSHSTDENKELLARGMRHGEGKGISARDMRYEDEDYEEVEEDDELERNRRFLPLPIRDRRMIRLDDNSSGIAGKRIRFSGDDRADSLARATRSSSYEADTEGRRVVRFPISDAKEYTRGNIRKANDEALARSSRHAAGEVEGSRKMRHESDASREDIARAMRYAEDDSRDELERSGRYAKDESREDIARAMRSAKEVSRDELARAIRYANDESRDYAAREMRHAKHHGLAPVGVIGVRSADDSRDEAERTGRYANDESIDDTARETRFAKHHGLAPVGVIGLRSADDSRDEAERTGRYANDESIEDTAREMRYAKHHGLAPVGVIGVRSAEDNRDELERTGRYAKDESREDNARDMRYVKYGSHGEETIIGLRNAADAGEDVKRGTRFSYDDRNARQIEASPAASSSAATASEAVRKDRYADDSEENGPEASDRQRRIFGILDDYIPGWKRSLSDETGEVKTDIIRRKKRFVPAFDKSGMRAHSVSYKPRISTRKVLDDTSQVNRRQTRAKAAANRHAQRTTSSKDRQKRRPGAQTRRSAKANKKQAATTIIARK